MWMPHCAHAIIAIGAAAGFGADFADAAGRSTRRRREPVNNQTSANTANRMTRSFIELPSSDWGALQQHFEHEA